MAGTRRPVSTTIALERFTEPLFALLEEAFEKPRGMFLDSGTSLFETLERVSAAEASQRLAEGRPTIAAQVEHVRFYVDVLDRYMRGENLGEIDWKEIWRRVDAVSPEEWRAMKTRLHASYKRTSSYARSQEAWDGKNEIGGALAIVVHTAYHLGQIRLSLLGVRAAGRRG
jgi:hypothetical protein